MGRLPARVWKTTALGEARRGGVVCGLWPWAVEAAPLEAGRVTPVTAEEQSGGGGRSCTEITLDTSKKG